MSLVIGITGGIASGKTTVENYLIKKGYSVICADKVYHNILKNNQSLKKKLVESFGKEILNTKGVVDRKKLAKIVFTERKLLNKLNNITHPVIIKKIDELVNENHKNKFVFVSVPLLFEIGMQHKFYKIVNVYINKKLQIKRLCKRNKCSIKESLNIINNQMPLYKKNKLSDFVLKNNDTKKILYKKIDKFLLKL